MLDPNKEYRTKHNEPIRIYAVDEGASGTEIHGTIKYSYGWRLAVWWDEQEFFNEGNKEYNPLTQLKAGDPIIVWDTLSPSERFIRIFTGSICAGKPQVYAHGLLDNRISASFDNFELLPNYNYGD